MGAPERWMRSAEDGSVPESGNFGSYLVHY